MASTHHWDSAYRNTNLLQILFPKVKPPQVFPQIKRFENGFEKNSLIWKLFPWSWLKTLFSPISLTGKSFQNFPWFPWSAGTLLRRNNRRGRSKWITDLFTPNIMGSYDCDFQRAQESEKIFDTIDPIGTAIHTQKEFDNRYQNFRTTIAGLNRRLAA